MRPVRTLSFAVALSLASATAFAKSESADAVVQLNVNEPPAAQLSRIERALHAEEYSEIGIEDRSKVQASLNRIRVRMGDHTSVEALNPQARTDVFNDQELINTILTRAHADSRMVCRRERATGSNRPQQVCMTVAQRREASENAKDALRNYHRVNPRTGTP